MISSQTQGTGTGAGEVPQQERLTSVLDGCLNLLSELDALVSGAEQGLGIGQPEPADTKEPQPHGACGQSFAIRSKLQQIRGRLNEIAERV